MRFLIVLFTMSAFFNPAAVAKPVSLKIVEKSAHAKLGSYTFGSLLVKETAQITVGAENVGTVPSTITFSVVQGAAAMSVVSNQCHGVLNPGQTCEFTVVFKPHSAGLSSAQYRVTGVGVINENGETHTSIVDYDFVGKGLAYVENLPESGSFCAEGSIINVNNLSVGESIGVANTNISLHYSSQFSAEFQTSYQNALFPSFNPEAWSVSSVHRYDIANQVIYMGNNTILKRSSIDLGDGMISVLGENEIYTFDLGGKHVQTRSQLTGLTLLTFQYGSDLKISKITDRYGNETIFNRTLGVLSSITSPHGVETFIHTNSQGYISAIIQPDGYKYQIEYYVGSRLLKKFTKPNGQFSTMSYSEAGKLMSDQSSDGTGKTFEIVNFGENYLHVGQTSNSNRRTLYMFSHNAQRTSSSRDFINIFSTDEDLDGMSSTQSFDGAYITSKYEYDARFGTHKKVLKSSSELLTGNEISSYRMSNFEQSIQDFINFFNYTNLISYERSYFISGTYEGSQNFNLSQRKFTTLDFNGVKTEVLLDLQERPVSASVGNVVPWTYTYDSNGRLESMRQGARNQMNLEYNSKGYVHSVENSRGEKNIYTYDLMGRVLSALSPDARMTSFTYDSMGNVITITPAGRPAHSFTYDIKNVPLKYSPPIIGSLDSSVRYSYDKDKTLTRVQKPHGKTIDYNYDDELRLSSINAGNEKQTFYYRDEEERPYASLSFDGIKSELNFYGNLFGLENQFENNTPISSVKLIRGDAHFPLNRIINSVYLDKSRFTNFEYSGYGLVGKIGALNTSYDSLGRIDIQTLGNIESKRSYDGFGYLETYSVKNKVTNLTLFRYEVSRDTEGRIVGKNEISLGREASFEYSYDLAGRLKSVKKDGVQVSSYNYDENGNRTSGLINGQSFSATYDDQDRLITFNQNLYAYNKNGELLNIERGILPKDSLEYDALGRMTSYTSGSGKDISYLKDWEGKRLWRFVDGKKSKFNIYESKFRLAMQIDIESGMNKEFVYLSDVNSPDYMSYKDETYFFIKDHLGSPRLIVKSSNGEVVQRLDYNEWGKVLVNTNRGFQPFGFAGGIYDEDTKLLNFVARDYDPEVGRWTSKDPILFGGGDTNLYGYTWNDPVNFVDPMGLWGFQVGVGFSGFFLTGGAAFNVGIAVVGNESGLQFSNFFSSQFNGGLGFSAGRGIQASYTPGAKCMSDLEGTSVGAGFDSPFGGFTYSSGSAGPTYTISGPSLGASIFGFTSGTQMGSPFSVVPQKK